MQPDGKESKSMGHESGGQRRVSESSRLRALQRSLVQERGPKGLEPECCSAGVNPVE